MNRQTDIKNKRKKDRQKDRYTRQRAFKTESMTYRSTPIGGGERKQDKRHSKRGGRFVEKSVDKADQRRFRREDNLKKTTTQKKKKEEDEEGESSMTRRKRRRRRRTTTKKKK